jgi:hypothetical protein
MDNTNVIDSIIALYNKLIQGTLTVSTLTATNNININNNLNIKSNIKSNIIDVKTCLSNLFTTDNNGIVFITMQYSGGQLIKIVDNNNNDFDGDKWVVMAAGSKFSGNGKFIYCFVKDNKWYTSFCMYDKESVSRNKNIQAYTSLIDMVGKKLNNDPKTIANFIAIPINMFSINSKQYLPYSNKVIDNNKSLQCIDIPNIPATSEDSCANGFK